MMMMIIIIIIKQMSVTARPLYKHYKKRAACGVATGCRNHQKRSKLFG